MFKLQKEWMRFWIAFTVLTVLITPNKVHSQTTSHLPPLDQEVLRLKQTIIYLNDYALKSCRTSRDSLLVLALAQETTIAFYHSKVNSLQAKLEETEAKLKAQNERQNKIYTFLFFLIGLLTVLAVL